MAVDSSLIDRIVHGVLTGLAAPSPERSSSTRQAAPPAPQRPGLRLDQPIITAEVLDQYVPGTKVRLIVGPRAIVTPAALDVIRARRLIIQRDTAPAPLPQSDHRRLAIVLQSTPALERMLGDRPCGWQRVLAGDAPEAAALAISAICRGEARVVVVFSAQPHWAACQANRHAAVRAAAVGTLDEWRRACDEMLANVACFDPLNRADFELRRWLDQLPQTPDSSK